MKNEWTYEHTCKAILKIGLYPLFNPEQRYIDKALQVVKRCLSSYKPRQDELELMGVVIYDDQLQINPTLKNSYGYAVEIEQGQAIIGLSTTLFNNSRCETFYDIVFLHELAHLAVMNHGDDFEIRLHSILYDYYTDHNVRIDGKEVILQRNTIYY